MKRRNRRILIGAASLLLIIGIILAFWRFSVGNRDRIATQNEEYLLELTAQRASSINRMMGENLNFIENTAYLYAESLTSAEADVSVIRRYEESTAFEMLRFIDQNGDNYTSNGKAANLSDRAYFQSGMQGETGITYVEQSRVTGQKQLGYYSPVYYAGEIIGVMVGFYGEDYIQHMLDYELFGYEGEGWLCTPEGFVVGSTLSEEPHNYLEYLADTGRCTDAELATVKQAFEDGAAASFSYTVGNRETAAYIVPLEHDGWLLIRCFPPEASDGILRRANQEGTRLLSALMILFVIYITVLVIYFAVEKKRTREANKKANDISIGVANIFEKFAVLDLTKEEWAYIEGDPDDRNLPTVGSFKDFYTSFLSRVPEQAQRKETEDFIQPQHLRQILMDTDTASIRVHAPIGREDLWYTYSFIVIARDAGGAASRLLVVRQDVTKLHEKEEQDNLILREALDAAEKASRAKTEFLFNMSHDIRTPMNAIMGYTDIARSHSDDRALVEDSLDKIKASSEHLLSLINDVLDMSRIESGKMKLHNEAFSVGASLQKLQDLIRLQAEKKNQTVALRQNIEHPMIYADPLRLNQVLLNILSNAVKYTPDGGRIEILAEEREGEAPGTAIYRFCVKDNGIGMSEEYLPHLFENFSREYNSTISRVQGTGLGMSIARNLIDLMGGAIEVKSRIGEGSEFTVTLPAVYVEQQQTAHGAEASQADADSLTGLRLLLAEDNMINAEIAQMMLSEAGFAVTHVENGLLAVEKLRQAHDAFDAVLMDVQMPVMDGYAATREIRKLEAEQKLPAIPVIAMTANTFDDDKKNASRAGMDAHIGKPYQQEEMLRTVAAYASAYHKRRKEDEEEARC